MLGNGARRQPFQVSDPATARLALRLRLWEVRARERDGGDATLPESFGDLLRERRVAASLTQEQLAELCHLSPKTIAALEQGRRRTPRLSTVKEIAVALGLDEAARTELARAAAGGAPGFSWSPGIRPGFSPAPVGDLSPSCRCIRLPAPVTPLIGRQAAINEIRQK